MVVSKNKKRIDTTHTRDVVTCPIKVVVLVEYDVFMTFTVEFHDIAPFVKRDSLSTFSPPGVSAGEPGADIDAERERGPIRRDLFASDERAGDACNADGSGDLRPPDGEGVRWRE